MPRKSGSVGAQGWADEESTINHVGARNKRGVFSYASSRNSARERPFPPLQRTSSFLEGIGGVAKKSGLPAFWQFAHDVRSFLLSSHKEATTTMVVETQSPKKPLCLPARTARLPGVAAMGRRVGRQPRRSHHRRLR
jgi:hypothetical protein